MGAFDALAVLGSGVAQGYRGNQELLRQLREAKRRALLEASESKAKLGLIGQQTLESQTNRFKTQDEIDRAKRLEESLNKPVSGDMFGGDINFHGTRGELDRYSDIIGHILSEKGTERAAQIGASGRSNVEEVRHQFQIDYPELFGKGAGGKGNPRADLVKHIFDLGNMETLTPEKAKSALDIRLKFLESNRDRLDRLLMAPEDIPASADSTGNQSDSTSVGKDLTPEEKWNLYLQRKNRKK